MKSGQFSKKTFEEILTALSGFSKGRYNVKLEATDDPQANSIIDEINKVAQALKAQALIDRELNETSELQKSNQNTIDSLPVGVAKLDLNRRFISVNPAVTSILGYSAEELKKLSVFDITHPEDIQRSTVAADKAFGTLTAVRHEERYIHKSGKVIWVRITANLVSSDINGNAQIAGIMEDVTKEKEIEAKIAEQSKQLTLITDSIPGPVSRVDRLGRYVFANKAYEDWFGLSRDQIVGKTHREILPPKIFSVAEEYLNRAMSGEQFSHEASIVTQNGKQRYVQTTFIPYLDADSRPDGYFRFVHDISAIKEAEAKLVQSSKLASLGEMSAGMAHEIRNPLAIIASSAGLLPKFVHNPEKFAKKIEAILKATGRIAKIVGGLKKFSRISEKNNKGNCVLAEILKEALILTDAKSKRNDTPISCEFNSNSVIFCDQVEIEQVLINVINNAIDAVKGRAEKWVKIKLSEDAQSVVLRVIDSGLGIPEDVRSKLFDPFFTTKAVGEGTGLGLSITKGILDEHKATIRVVTECSNTCFEIRFPKAEPNTDVA